MNPQGVVGLNGTLITKKNRIQNNIEETKINFFDPKSFGGNGGIGIEGEDEYGEEQAKQTDQIDKDILEGKIDPSEWRKEMDRVYQDLDTIEKEIELNR